jgi:hypothetical protein
MYARLIPALMIFGIAPFTTGCSSMSHTGEGALAGGAIGAGTGALISKATGGSAGTGAVVGGLVGAVAGGAIGNEQDQREKQALQARAAAAGQMGVFDVIQWTKAGRSEDEIINQIRATNSTFVLSAEDISGLKANNVGDRVIAEMQYRRPGMYRHGYVVAPPPPPPGYMVVEPTPAYVVAPPPTVGVVGVGVRVR